MRFRVSAATIVIFVLFVIVALGSSGARREQERDAAADARAARVERLDEVKAGLVRQMHAVLQGELGSHGFNGRIDLRFEIKVFDHTDGNLLVVMTWSVVADGEFAGHVQVTGTLAEIPPAGDATWALATSSAAAGIVKLLTESAQKQAKGERDL